MNNYIITDCIKKAIRFVFGENMKIVFLYPISFVVFSLKSKCRQVGQ